MLRSLKEVQGDDGIVGFYVATPFSAFFTQNLLEMQSVHQERLRQGGIVVVHGQAHPYFYLRYELMGRGQTRRRHNGGMPRSDLSG
jgi:hypothetical protein